jgi:hypothetical protein
MSKKSYKRNQNRLYREIRRRIIAENELLKPVQFIKYDQKVATIKIRSMLPELPDYIEQTKDYIEFLESDMTKKIVEKLVEDGYIKFNYSGDYHRIADDEEVMNISEIEARICVVKPT